MSIKGWYNKEIIFPRGQWSSIQEKGKGNPSRASLVQNMRFAPRVVKTRPGTATVYTVTDTVKGMYNWLAPNGANWLSYRKGTIIEAFLQGTGPTTLTSSIGTTYRPSFAELDVWEYFCGYDTLGRGTIQTQIFDGTNIDKAFAPPIKFTSSSITILAGGLCTIGNHYIGFVYQNRSGFEGRPTTDTRYIIAATNNGTPDVLTIPGNTLANGEVVEISGCLGDTAPNGERIIANVGVAGPGTFNIQDDTHTLINGNGVYVPNSGLLVDPLTIETTAITGATIQVTVTLPARTDGGANPAGGQATLFMIATPVDNPGEWFFVPPPVGASKTINELPVPFNTPVTLTFIMDCDDTTLRQSDSAQNQFLLFTQDDAGNGPFDPNFVVAYGQRMCYGTGTTLYASDINQPQQIAPDRNAVVMPNQRYIGSAFALPGGTDLFLSGNKWTARVSDNSDIPATWSQPIGVSDAIGAELPNLVQAKTAGGYVWVAAEPGLYLFNGRYQERPITFLISDVWKRINWQAAYAIEIADDVKNLKVYVAVPLDGSVKCNACIVMDYQNCADAPVYDAVDFSLDVYTPQIFGSIAVILQADTGLSNIWIGPDGAGDVYKFFDNYLNDKNNSAPIHSFWESGLVRQPEEVETAMIRVGQQFAWVRGNTRQPQDLIITIFGPDRTRSVQPLLLTKQGYPSVLSPNPGLSYMTKSDLNRVENFTTRFETNALDAWIEISSFSPYYKASSSNR